jgi:hypothetical protein
MARTSVKNCKVHCVQNFGIPVSVFFLWSLEVELTAGSVGPPLLISSNRWWLLVPKKYLAATRYLLRGYRTLNSAVLHTALTIPGTDGTYGRYRTWTAPSRYGRYEPYRQEPTTVLLTEKDQ